jgi:hypothetical protein
MKRVFAFPEAKSLLDRGSNMIDWATNEFVYSKFRRKLELAGVTVKKDGTPNGS